MRRVRPRDVLLAAVAGLAGCAQPGPMISRHTTVGTLKTSVAKLEHDNEQLRGELAELQAENRRINYRLTQEEEANGTLTARLNDANHILRKQGLATDDTTFPASNEERASAPATRPQRKTRKPPVAKISGNADGDTLDLDADETPPPRSSRGFEDDLGPQSRLDRSKQWLPIAAAASAKPKSKVR